MRLFKIGSLKSDGKFGIRVVVVESVNPFRQVVDALKPIFWLRRTGLMRSLKLPFLRIIWAVRKHNPSLDQTARKPGQ